MNEILEIVSFDDILNLKYIKQILKSIIIQPELIMYLKKIDYRSFDEIIQKDDLNKLKLSHCINFLIDNRKNLYKIIDYEKLKTKKIKVKNVIKFESYSKWINIYKLISFLAKLKT